MNVKVQSKRFISVICLCCACFFLFATSPLVAQSLPGSADPSRIEPLQEQDLNNYSPSDQFPEIDPDSRAPEGTEDVIFTLKQLNVEGVTAFSEAEIATIYQPYVNQDVPLSDLWLIASQITQFYQNEGYFLTRAYVPAQQIDGGIATIIVVEGYIVAVDIEDEGLTERALVRALVERITAKKPLNAVDLESFMLQMNALPGKNFRAFVEPISTEEAGITRLLLQPEKEKASASVSFDNSGSRFLGPYQVTFSYQDSFLPLQQTSLSVLASTPVDELKYLAVRHSVPLFPDWKIDFSGSYVTAAPGSSLEQNDIRSDSIDLGIVLTWQPIRLRQENLIASLELTGKNTNGDILGNTPLIRDRLRVARAQLSYDTNDRWNGYNYLTLSVNQGLEILGASDEGDSNLSRSEAESDFTALKFRYTRQQAFPNNFVAIGKLSGQLASGQLLSSEEFGYGGQSFGRAYDPSEITGDHGVSASLEVRYLGFDPWQGLIFAPYAFYDIGKVWNEDTGGKDESGTSTGLGMLFNHSSGFSGNLGLAWPLSREISKPIYGNGSNPRILMQVGYEF